ncbi:MAG TPA: tripartite tricarboxylate transporter substrate binding protein [Xanthobacteraceae bacterium]|nr:tripartite tricarboxylate transporter substrate binding protein [Xanthobacteraceae bacterium]
MSDDLAGRTPRRRMLQCAGALAFAILLAPAAAQAQSKYPDRPVKFVVPFAAGGATDIIARAIGQPLSQVLGQSVIIENRPGAGSNLGAGVVAKSEPDGYTFLLASSGIIASPALYRSLTYDVTKDLTPVAELVTTTNLIVSKPGSGLDTLADVINRAKANPGTMNYVHPGVGTTPQLAFELLKLRANITVQSVAYGGAAPASQAILAGTVPLGSMALANIHGQVKAGTFKGVAVTGATRWHDLPDIPTVQESGYKDFDFETIFLLMAPAGTPQEIIRRMSKEVIAILQSPEVSQRVKAAGYDVLARGPEALKARMEKEIPLYKDIVQRAGIPVN